MVNIYIYLERDRVETNLSINRLHYTVNTTCLDMLGTMCQNAGNWWTSLKENEETMSTVLPNGKVTEHNRIKKKKIF